MSKINPVAVAAISIVTIAVGILAGRALATELRTQPAPATSSVVAAPSVPAPIAPVPTVPAPVETTPAAAPTVPAPAEIDTHKADRTAETPETIGDRIDRFVEAFSTAHDNADIDVLIASMHPAMGQAFGEDACAEYVEATMGSITAMSVISVGEPTEFALTSPAGEITFFAANPVTAEWTVVHSGESQRLLFHVAEADGELRWMTTCGWSAS